MCFFYLNWLSWTAVGALLGNQIPGLAVLGLDFAMIATFAAMVAPQLKFSTPVAVALVSGSVAWMAHALPYKLGLILAALAGITIGMILDARKRRAHEEASPFMSDFMWTVILGMFAFTFLIRASFLVFGHGLRFPPVVVQALSYVPVAVLSAIIVPEAVAPDGQLNFSFTNPYLLGTLVAGLIAWKTGRTLTAVGVSFFVFGLLRWLT